MTGYRTLRPLALLALLGLPGAGEACDPNHDWRPIRELSWRAPSVQLLSDALQHALHRAEVTGPARVAVLMLEDSYAVRAGLLGPGQEPEDLTPPQAEGLSRQLRADLEDRLLGDGVEVVPMEAIDAVLAEGGELAAWEPRVHQALARDHGATHLARISLVHYTASMIVDEDLLPANRGLYRDRRNDSMQVRIALSDAEGDTVFIDEMHARQNDYVLYWDRREDGLRDLVLREEVRYGRNDGLRFHSAAEHGGEAFVGALPVQRREP